ncbi:GRAM domain-containing protein 2B [Polypterus senegalus]|uniref:GRAM domain-containing protein 2B n=1 Tax=Polypterus senegalus TaxID=55291 RepID=UPI001962D819|nr:GRAM domain-containing protein 2B [Polypterus senegalus]
MVLMIEQQQPSQLPPPPPCPSPLLTPVEEAKPFRSVSKKELKGVTFHSEGENGSEEKPKKAGKPLELLHSLNIDAELSEIKKKQSPSRLKIVDQQFAQNPPEYETKIERRKSSSTQLSKANLQFHKLFKEMAQGEQLRQSYTCALQKDILYQGKLYVSDNWICFCSKVFGKDTKIAISVMSVTLIKKTKTALLVPNALVIETLSDRHMFVSLLSRDATYKFLKSICVHLDSKSAGTSPVASSDNSSFRMERPTSLPLNFTDFSDLDGAVRPRRQELEETTSSGSQTPEFENVAEFPGVTKNFLNVVKSTQIPVHADIHIRQSPESKSFHRNDHSRIVSIMPKEKSFQPMTLNTLLVLYIVLVCILVLSSCYMAFKVMSLEQRLLSLGTPAEYRSNENLFRQGFGAQSTSNADVYGELTSNLAKLEKIQKNLQRLLDEAE